jgi:hypothetical protein
VLRISRTTRLLHRPVVYLHLLRQYSILHQCALVGYCLMSNHVHLIAVLGRADSLPVVLRASAAATPPISQRSTGCLGACLAGPLLLLSAGCPAPVGGASLCGAESGASGNGGAGGGVRVVERCRALRRFGHAWSARSGFLASGVDSSFVAEFSGHCGGGRSGADPAQHAHGPAAGRWRRRRAVGHESSCSTKSRSCSISRSRSEWKTGRLSLDSPWVSLLHSLPSLSFLG